MASEFVSITTQGMDKGLGMGREVVLSLAGPRGGTVTTQKLIDRAGEGAAGTAGDRDRKLGGKAMTNKLPTDEMPKDRMLGEPVGRIPTELPKNWDPMIVVGDNTETIHAVPTGTHALCGHESTTGWQWARGFGLTCEACFRKILEEEFEKDLIVKHLHKCGHTGPITRDDYISHNWAGLSLKDWRFEHEDQLPALLQCWDKSEWPWPKRRSRRRKGEQQK
jgi:hypothetical protein